MVPGTKVVNMHIVKSPASCFLWVFSFLLPVDDELVQRLGIFDKGTERYPDY